MSAALWARRHTFALAMLDSVLSVLAGALLPLLIALLVGAGLTLATIEIERAR